MSLPTSITARPVYGWDWSSTTHDALGSGLTTREVVKVVTDALGGVHHVPVGKGLQGWTDSVDSFDCEGFRLGRVYFGGDRTDCHVVATSAAADLVRGDVVGSTMMQLSAAKTARVDTRVDSMVPFEDLAQIMEESAEGYGSQIVEMKRREGRAGDRKDTGRTVYLGAPSSAVRVRLYEKWLESPGQYVEGTNRVEVQLRPPSKAKQEVSDWSRPRTFCASRVTRGLAERLGADLAPVASLHINRGTPDLEASLEAMCNQYGGTVQRWMNVSDGDIGTLLDYLLGKS